MRSFTLYVIVFLGILLCPLGSLLAQTQITGTLKDNTGAALPGVSVLEKGTTNGTVTGGDGRYSLTVKPGATLVFSSVGFVTQEIAAGSNTTIDLSLEEDIALLSDVVVVGYGEQEKRDITGAMATLKSTDFNAGVINAPEQLFQGKISGVQVTQNNGEPGGGISINIRGASSIRSGNNPLYVVDGFPLDGRDVSAAGTSSIGGLGNPPSRNPLNFINPDDIERVEVLKDASATAIYGSRGANGVILITTKRAKAGESVLNFNAYTGISQLPKKIDLLDAGNYVNAAVAAGAQASQVNYGGSTDWQDEVFRTAPIYSTSLSFAKGTENSAYRMSLSYLNQEGIVRRSGFERITGRANVTQKLIKDRLKMDLQLTVGHTNDNYSPITNDAGFQGSLIGAMLQANPTIPFRRADGSFVQKGETVNNVGVSSDFNNPIAMIEYITNKGKTTRILANVSPTLTIAKGLEFKSNFGIDNSNSITRVAYDSRFVVNPGEQFPGAAAILDVAVFSWINENFLTYKTEFGNSKLTILGGYSYQEFINRGHGFWVNGTGIPGLPDFGFDNVGIGRDLNNRQQYSYNQTNKLQSYYARINYGFANKYNLTATIRADGSSRFGDNNRYGIFPSLGANWILSEEDFIPDFFDDLVLRASWGITGNQEFPNGTSQPILSVDPGSGNLTQVTTANPDIKWEQTTQWNVGVDFALLKGKLFGTIDYFRKNTTDLLVQLQVPQPAFTQFAWQNLDADLINSGLEFSLNAPILDKGGFTIDVNGNFTYYFTNELKGLGSSFFNTGAINGQGLSGAYAQRIAEGQSLGAFYMLTFTGFENGIARYANNDRLGFVGSALPDFIYGFTTNFAFKGIELSMSFNGVGGNEIYNNTANALFTKGALFNGRNVTVDAANSAESAQNAPDVSTFYLEKGSFLRMNNFALGYNFKIGGNGAVKKLRVYVSGQNLFTITDYSGYDPEVNINKQINGVPSFGIDYTGFPRNRTFNFGVNVGF